MPTSNTVGYQDRNRDPGQRREPPFVEITNYRKGPHQDMSGPSIHTNFAFALLADQPTGLRATTLF